MAEPEKKKEGGFSSSYEFKILKKLLESKLMYVFIAAAFILFLVTKSSIFSMLAVVLVLIVLVGESIIGIGEHGAKKELLEIVLAIVAALVIWFGMGFVLSTNAPLNAIVSCSMLPNLGRGDLVILQGAEPSGVEVYVDKFDFTDISAKVDGEKEVKTGLSLAQYCGIYSSSSVCQAYLTNPETVTERYGPLEFKHGICKIISGGREFETPCVKSIAVNGTEYKYGDLKGDTIVYTTLPTDQFSLNSGGPKEIIHRVFMKVHAGGQTYYLTKGDNNDRFDIQYNNSPPIPKRTAGKVIFKLPYVGYFKLFLFGYIADPQGCDRTFSER
jgi:signal peptidase I